MTSTRRTFKHWAQSAREWLRSQSKQARLVEGTAAMALFGALLGCEPAPPKPVAQNDAPVLATASLRAAPVASPATLKNLEALVGSYPGERTDYLREGALAVRLQQLLGDSYPVVLRNLGTSGPLTREGDLIYITGNRPHRGGEEAAAIAIDTQRNALRVWLLHAGKTQDMTDPVASHVEWPHDVQMMQTQAQLWQPRRG